MTNRPKAIGTAAETLVTRWLQAHGYPHATRRALTGNQDQGDILVTPAFIIEVKAGAQTRQPGDALLDAWTRQTWDELSNHRADMARRGSHPGISLHALLVLQRHGTRDVSRWWTVHRGVAQGYVWSELGEALLDSAVTPYAHQPGPCPWLDGDGAA